jgi:hypothetical protein
MNPYSEPNFKNFRDTQVVTHKKCGSKLILVQLKLLYLNDITQIL